MTSQEHSHNIGCLFTWIGGGSCPRYESVNVKMMWRGKEVDEALVVAMSDAEYKALRRSVAIEIEEALTHFKRWT